MSKISEENGWTRIGDSCPIPDEFMKGMLIVKREDKGIWAKPMVGNSPKTPEQIAKEEADYKAKLNAYSVEGAKYGLPPCEPKKIREYMSLIAKAKAPIIAKEKAEAKALRDKQRAETKAAKEKLASEIKALRDKQKAELEALKSQKA